MSLEPELRELMPHTIQIRPWTGNTVDGTPTYGTAVSYRALVEGKIMTLRTMTQAELTLVFQVYVDAGDAVIDPRDLLILPNQTTFGRATPKIFTVSKLSDEHGNHHTSLACGFMYHRQGLV
jgi:hypothetical protein